MPSSAAGAAQVVYRDHLPATLLGGPPGPPSGGAAQHPLAAAPWYEVVSKGKISVRAEPNGASEELGLLQPGEALARAGSTVVGVTWAPGKSSKS